MIEYSGVNYYNTKRLHSSLFYLAQGDFLLGRVEEKLNEREQKLKEDKQNRTKVRYAS